MVHACECGPADGYEERLLAALSSGVHQRLAVTRAAGRDPRDLGAPDDLAARMLSVVPAAHPWDEQIGPFYDTAGLTRLLAVSKQALFDRVRRGTLLAVTTNDGHVLYPAFQWYGHEPAPGVTSALAAFRSTEVDGWTVAAWFTTAAAALGGATPVACWRGAGTPLRSPCSPTRPRFAGRREPSSPACRFLPMPTPQTSTMSGPRGSW